MASFRFAKTSSIFGVCLKSLIFLWGNLSGQVFLGSTEQMLGPSLCSRKKSEYSPLGFDDSILVMQIDR